jgi:hypothetical protein
MNLWIAENAENEKAFGFYAVTEGILNGGGGLMASAEATALLNNVRALGRDNRAATIA